MATHSKNDEMAKLQQDAPVAMLPTLPNVEEINTETEKQAKATKETPRPFFLYPRDGLYGLL